jgi:hypothetical protein
MGKLKLIMKNAPEGVGAKQLFEGKTQMDDTLQQWKDEGKMSNISIKASNLTFETNIGTVEGQIKGSGLISPVADDFVFEEENPE